MIDHIGKFGGVRLGYVQVSLAGILWALSGPIIRMLQVEGITCWDVVLARALFSAVFLGIWVVGKHLAQRKRAESQNPVQIRLLPAKRDITTFVFMGFLGVILAQSTYFYAISQISLAAAVTLNYTAPFFVMLISYFAFKDPITKDKAAALLAALLGVALVSGFIGIGAKPVVGSAFGIFMAALSGLAFGSQTLAFKHVGKKFTPIFMNLWMMAFGFLELCIIMTLATGEISVFSKLMAASPRTWAPFSVMGLGPGLGAFVLFADGINKVDAGRGSIVAMCEPVAACLLGYFVLGETLTISQILGVVLVIGAVLGVSLSSAGKKGARVVE